MVEEFMLLANISVAQKIYDEFPDCAMLRKHPAPPPSNYDILHKASRSKVRELLKFIQFSREWLTVPFGLFVLRPALSPQTSVSFSYFPELSLMSPPGYLEPRQRCYSRYSASFFHLFPSECPDPHRFSQGSGRLPGQGQRGRLPLLQHAAAYPGHPLHDAGCVFLFWHGQRFSPLWSGLTHLYTLHVAY